MSAPQTPRLKSKLSLDIPPSSYSDFNSPISPSSPFNPIPSPTLSGSWYVNKSQAELTALVKEAYNFIKEKERDLTLAAEIGKSLLENNIALKAKYEVLLGQYQNLQRQQQKAAAIALQANAIKKPSAVPIARPNSSLDPFMGDTSDFEESDTDSINNGYASSTDMHSSTASNNLDIESINELESRNQDLQTRLDEVIKEFDESDKSNKAKIRKLEADLKHYRDEYSLATQKIEDLDNETKRLIQKQTSDFWKTKYDKKSSKNDEFIEILVNKVAELEEQNHNIERAKAETEKKLSRVIGELDMLQEEFNELVDQSKNYDILQLENQEQSQLIIQLRDRLEEEQSKVVSLRSGILYSRSNSRSNSFSENALRRLSDPDRMRSLFGTVPQTPTGPTPSSSGNGGGGLGGLGGKIKRTLLSELENEWFRELTLFQRDIKKSGGNDDGSPPFSPVLSERALSDYFLNNGSHVDDDDVSNIDYLSEFSFIEEFDTDNEKAIRIREWFWRRWARNVYLFFRLIWRWIKFILILIAANIMAIYRGPDDILPDDM
ncbi:10187_t:CDS:2 [Entrophospora sp. SA101]|nr:15862_t:CDS:2 [Entrophospora sp. SA101]CAJ0643546.1 10187_t:CDS:2 [Entrophospora sp. SA101]CAJ0829654.1 9383_t:CDS:2 [Entrophospora sp. SA101]CAJ0904681.1 452_t:CDS:2 [Entrophospora sp. SA101]CAJ0920946.1 20357_t:CDS:2 [Entrophospora sp. SA101]